MFVGKLRGIKSLGRRLWAASCHLFNNLFDKKKKSGTWKIIPPNITLSDTSSSYQIFQFVSLYIWEYYGGEVIMLWFFLTLRDLHNKPTKIKYISLLYHQRSVKAQMFNSHGMSIFICVHQFSCKLNLYENNFVIESL